MPTASFDFCLFVTVHDDVSKKLFPKGKYATPLESLQLWLFEHHCELLLCGKPDFMIVSDASFHFKSSKSWLVS